MAYAMSSGGKRDSSWTPPGTHSHKVQVVGDVLLVNYERSFEPNATSWQGGLKVFDISKPSQPREIAFLKRAGKDVHRMTYWEPPFACMSGSDGGDILVVTDEQLAADCAGMQTRVRVVSIEDELHPAVIAEFPVPEGDFSARGGRFGPHNLHEMRPGSLVDSNTVYVTWFNAGVRVVDISDARRPREIAYYVPEPPPGRSSIQLNDLVVTADGLIYVTDRFTGGPYILDRTA